MPITSDLCGAMCIAENHLFAMQCIFTTICAVVAEIHCNAGHDARGPLKNLWKPLVLLLWGIYVWRASHERCPKACLWPLRLRPSILCVLGKALGQQIPKKTKGDGGKGTGKKNVTTICDKRHDNLRHVTTICDILWQFPSLCSIDIKRHKTS